MPTPSKAGVAELFKKSGSAIGLDDASSGILIHNLNASIMPLCSGSPFLAEEAETDDFRVLMLMLDQSGSMEPVADDLIECVNDVLIPGLLGGALNAVGAIRVGGIVFGSNVKPLWGGGFIPLQKLPPLTAKEYSISGATALHQAVLDGVTATSAYALELIHKTGSNPEVVIVVLSDGANNQAPLDPDPVYQVLSKLSPELFTLAFLGFETSERVDFRAVAQAMGFRDIQESKAKPGETLDERRRRFRHLMNVFSGSVVGRMSTSRVGKAPASGSTGFWQSPPATP
ncbi:MAG: hypothetical protein A3A44_00870 [Candidatus Sungbacteria bacterium RIFCSPLOWO2_01_FULL_60_25]|uniref:VWFA domain-containing protein n=1 Tax=Candidatus Sungbacteria bacterium RIFCSPLOWO2_01_FULL_60_25 TaxID=1802281 RepID=A0A1G2L9Z2_9BACT|nr:MAG: hypothetical protein A3A44_00870 [Candidatus Sungbacteria bacterium RIFCSPLOWO2_01_FULL_60_25]